MVLTQRLPSAARSYAVAQRREINAAVAASGRLWRRIDAANIDASWSRVAPVIQAILMQAQERVAGGALAYVPDVLEDTGQLDVIAPLASPQAAPLIGMAGDGRPLGSLLDETVIGAKSLIAQGATPGQALAQRGSWLSMAAGTLLSDTARQGESLGMGVRRVGGYVRMLNPPSCARCVILAGKWYRKNQGFARHPRCDCRHIPASESMAEDLTVNSVHYFDSLTKSQQNATFGSAGAEAIRNGADINQVVNARRGVATAQVGGRRVLATRESTTRRGVTPGRVRLMPETIALVARDQDDYLRLLRANGYLR